MAPAEEHAAKYKATNRALKHLSQLIHIFWARRLGRGPRISETSPYVQFAKEVFALVGKDSPSFDTIKPRLRDARRTIDALPR